jgi:hypothetical protein
MSFIFVYTLNPPIFIHNLSDFQGKLFSCYDDYFFMVNIIIVINEIDTNLYLAYTYLFEMDKIESSNQ